MEKVQMQLSDDLQAATQDMIKTALHGAVDEIQKENSYPPYMNKGEAANYVGISRSKFADWVSKYNIPSIKIESITRFKRETLDDFMKQHQE